MNHFTVLTDDVGATVGFYRDLLGLTEGPRRDEDRAVTRYRRARRVRRPGA
jgi:catechol 2,3-dioxygenase-like lactoylglutathione lyase family enzyme